MAGASSICGSRRHVNLRVIHCHVIYVLQVERAKLEKAVEDELAAEAAADEEAKQQKREQIAAEERRLQELEENRQAEVRVLARVCY